MSYDAVTFQSNLELVAKNYKWYLNKAVELNAVIAALNPDPTTRDTTLQKAPAGIIPGQRSNTPFTNDVLLLVNTGKGGNLSNTAMADLINGAMGNYLAPVNVTLPAATGTTTLSVTNGTWQYSPNSYAYQWLRGGANIAGATAATYTTVGADAGTNVSCRVTATNLAGSTPAISNVIAVP
jgi:hypothetical protein